MSINVRSNDPTDQAAAAESGLAEGKITETKSAQAKEESKASENQSEESDLSENEGQEETEEQEESGEDESDSEGEEKPKKKNGGFKKRIDKLNKRLSDKEREAEYWREQALKGKPQEEPQQKSKPSEAKAEGKPNSDDFESYADYIDALTDWKVEQKLSKEKASERENQLKKEHEKTVSTHIERVNSFKEKHEDFDDVISDIDDVIVPVAIQQAIVTSDNGPELMYHLAKNREELERICSLGAVQAARELGKFEAKLARASENQTKEIKTTKAPKPVTPVGAKSGSSRKSIYDDSLSQADYERLRMERSRRA